MLEEKFDFKNPKDWIEAFGGLILFISICFFVGLFAFIIYIKFALDDNYVDPESQIINAEMQVKDLIEEVSTGKKYITVKLPVGENAEKLLKEENYESFIKLGKRNEIIYKKINKETK